MLFKLCLIIKSVLQGLQKNRHHCGLPILATLTRFHHDARLYCFEFILSSFSPSAPLTVSLIRVKVQPPLGQYLQSGSLYGLGYCLHLPAYLHPYNGTPGPTLGRPRCLCARTRALSINNSSLSQDRPSLSFIITKPILVRMEVLGT